MSEVAGVRSEMGGVKSDMGGARFRVGAVRLSSGSPLAAEDSATDSLATVDISMVIGAGGGAEMGEGGSGLGAGPPPSTNRHCRTLVSFPPTDIR